MAQRHLVGEATVASKATTPGGSVFPGEEGRAPPGLAKQSAGFRRAVRGLRNK